MQAQRMLRLAQAGFLVILVAGCGRGAPTSAVRTEHRQPAFLGAHAAAGPAFQMPDGAFSVAQIPSGFSAWRAPKHEVGPGPGLSLDAQAFVNYQGQRFEVAVSRGLPVANATDPNRVPNFTPSAQKIQGRDTYSANNTLTGQREFEWVINATTLAAVTGVNMTDDQLLGIAGGVQGSH